MDIKIGDSFAESLRSVYRTCDTFLFNTRQIISKKGNTETIIRTEDGFTVSSVTKIRRLINMPIPRKWYMLNGKRNF